MLFREIIGQEETKQHLRQAVREGRIPHAQLFSGISGIGKLQLALAYAQYLNCPHRTDEDSCGVCPTCLQFEKLQHPDLHFVFPIVGSDETCDAFLPQWREIILNQHYFDLEYFFFFYRAIRLPAILYPFLSFRSTIRTNTGNIP